MQWCMEDYDFRTRDEMMLTKKTKQTIFSHLPCKRFQADPGWGAEYCINTWPSREGCESRSALMQGRSEPVSHSSARRLTS